VPSFRSVGSVGQVAGSGGSSPNQPAGGSVLSRLSLLRRDSSAGMPLLLFPDTQEGRLAQASASEDSIILVLRFSASWRPAVALGASAL
jgi:hypothetical protein